MKRSIIESALRRFAYVRELEQGIRDLLDCVRQRDEIIYVMKKFPEHAATIDMGVVYRPIVEKIMKEGAAKKATEVVDIEPLRVTRDNGKDYEPYHGLRKAVTLNTDGRKGCVQSDLLSRRVRRNGVSVHGVVYWSDELFWYIGKLVFVKETPVGLSAYSEDCQLICSELTAVSGLKASDDHGTQLCAR